MTRILEPTTFDELEAVRMMIRAFVAWARERYREEVDLVDRYFDPVAFNAELQGLPGKYARPRGRLLVSLHDEQPAGCIALRDLGDGTCEMKRMFVYPEFHGKGVGRALVSALVEEARRIGYSKMRLDTGPKQIEAQNLYRSTGFGFVGPYSPVPDELRNWLVFMELDLHAKSAAAK